jgi:hypothetical protein
MSVVGRLCLKTRKSRGFENLANDACWRFQPLQGSVETIRAPATGFAVFDMVPHVPASETHQRSWEFSVISEKGRFQHNRHVSDVSYHAGDVRSSGQTGHRGCAR